MITNEIAEIIALEKKKANLEEDLKQLNIKINMTKAKLYEEMENEDVTEIEQYGVTFKRTIEPQFSIDTHNWNDEKFFNFLKEQGLGDVIKTDPRVNAQTRVKVLKEYIQNGGTLPSFIKENEYATVKYSKPKALGVKEIL